jgi:hypothetical protein
MVYQVQETVPFFTPIESNKRPLFPLLKVPAYYFWFGGKVAEHIEGEQIDGKNLANRIEKNTNPIATTLKIVSYIVSLGIFPLVALLSLAILRSIYSFHYAIETLEGVVQFNEQAVWDLTHLPSEQLRFIFTDRLDEFAEERANYTEALQRVVELENDFDSDLPSQPPIAPVRRRLDFSHL